MDPVGEEEGRTGRHVGQRTYVCGETESERAPCSALSKPANQLSSGAQWGDFQWDMHVSVCVCVY